MEIKEKMETEIEKTPSQTHSVSPRELLLLLPVPHLVPKSCTRLGFRIPAFRIFGSLGSKTSNSNPPR